MNTTKILCIEDTPDNYKLIERLVGSLKSTKEIALFHAISASEAIELAQQHQFHLVLTDVMLPDTTIATFAHVLVHPLRKLIGNVRIIAITAYAFRSDRETVLAAGCDECYHKPIEIRELRPKLMEWLGEVQMPITT